MEAVQSSMLNFLEQSKQLVIPVYQRTYKWTKIHCKQLLKDILRVSDLNEKTHFLGTIVYITDQHYQATKINGLTIIDGQQRITTLSLLLMAMVNYLKEHPVEFKTAPLEIYNRFLVNHYLDKNENGYIKLKLTKHDKDFYEKLVRNEPINNKQHNIYNSYKFFYELIKAQKLNLDTLYDGIGKLMIVDVSLIRSKDDPQLIFESLNSTGAKLTPADLIRNFLLMDLNISFQNRIYNNYWFPLEISMKEKDELSVFVKDYLTLKSQRIPQNSAVYEEFKKFFLTNYDRSEENIENFANDLLHYSELYKKIVKQTETNKMINNYFTELQELDFKVVNPFLLKLYNFYVSGTIFSKEFELVLKLIVSFIIRRTICGLPTNSLGKVFLSLIKDVDEANCLISVEKILSSKRGVQRFPDDNEFKENFIYKDIYNLKNRRFILDKLENFNSKEIKNIDEFTIEHIMPQTTKLSDKWVKALGEDWKEVHSKYLHTIGNLTLTRANSEMGNKFFTEKNDMPNGYKDSATNLSRTLKGLDTWNESEILIRANELFMTASTIWSYPGCIEKSEEYNMILDFNDDWTGQKPDHFILMDEKHKVKNFTDLYTKAIGLIYELDPELFVDVINEGCFTKKLFCSIDPNDFVNNKAFKLPDSNLYINTNLNSEAKRVNLAMLFDRMGLTEEDFTIYL